MNKKLIGFVSSALAAGVIFAVGAGCGKEPSSIKDDPYKNVNKSLLYGIDEPLTEGYNISLGTAETSQVNGFSLETTVGLVSALGASSMRFRLPDDFLIEPGNYDEEEYKYLKKAANDLKTAGVTNLVGQACVIPKYSDFRITTSGNTAPRPSEDGYLSYMYALEEMWEAIAGLFPEITKWEVGNEYNSNVFLHPNGYKSVAGSLSEGSGGFTDDEHVKVVTDYVYYASRGLKKGNPNAKCVLPGLAPLNNSLATVEYFLSDMYAYIKSGDAPSGDVKSVDTDDYFDYLCWHPYTNKVDETWLKENNKIYQVAIDNGDEGKPVIFSEFGFSDIGNDERQEVQCEYIERAFGYMANDMPYLETCMEFRLFNCAYAEVWGGIGETYFGAFKEPENGVGFSPRKKAYTLQKIYGGKGDLKKYE